MGMEIETKSRVIQSTPTISTSIYASGDQLGSLMELTNAMDDSSGTGQVLSLSILDRSSQSSILQVLLFNDLPTVASSDNGALNIADAEMASKCVGHISVVAADYFALSASSMACVRNINLMVNSVNSVTNPTGKSLWAIIRCGGTPTYAGTTDLTLSFGIRQD